MGKSYIGIDIGGTKCAIVQGNRQGQILKKAQFATAAGGGPAAILEKLSAQIEAWQVEDLAGIGVSCGGPLDSEHGVILSPPNLPCKMTPTHARLRSGALEPGGDAAIWCS